MIKQRTCGNEQFRSCDSDPNTHKCKNCDYSFGEEIKEGDEFVGKCDSCDFEKTLVCSGHTRSYNKETASFEGGECNLYGICDQCKKESKIIDPLYEPFREGTYGYDKHYKNYSFEKFVSQREEALEKIVSLPKELIKHLLRDLYDTVER